MPTMIHTRVLNHSAHAVLSPLDFPPSLIDLMQKP